MDTLSSKFVGHLIHTFNGNIETVLNVDDLLLIIKRDG